jgi:hypothetical protein
MMDQVITSWGFVLRGEPIPKQTATEQKPKEDKPKKKEKAAKAKESKNKKKSKEEDTTAKPKKEKKKSKDEKKEDDTPTKKKSEDAEVKNTKTAKSKKDPLEGYVNAIEKVNYDPMAHGIVVISEKKAKRDPLVFISAEEEGGVPGVIFMGPYKEVEEMRDFLMKTELLRLLTTQTVLTDGKIVSAKSGLFLTFPTLASTGRSAWDKSPIPCTESATISGVGISVKRSLANLKHMGIDDLQTLNEIDPAQMNRFAGYFADLFDLVCICALGGSVTERDIKMIKKDSKPFYTFYDRLHNRKLSGKHWLDHFLLGDDLSQSTVVSLNTAAIRQKEALLTKIMALVSDIQDEKSTVHQLLKKWGQNAKKRGALVRALGDVIAPCIEDTKEKHLDLLVLPPGEQEDYESEDDSMEESESQFVVEDTTVQYRKEDEPTIGNFVEGTDSDEEKDFIPEDEEDLSEDDLEGEEEDETKPLVDETLPEEDPEATADPDVDAIGAGMTPRNAILSKQQERFLGHMSLADRILQNSKKRLGRVAETLEREIAEADSQIKFAEPKIYKSPFLDGGLLKK